MKDIRETIGDKEIQSNSMVRRTNQVVSSNGSVMKSLESSSGKQITTTNTQTIPSNRNPITGSNIDVEYSEIPSHMHAVCDILPCPHAKTIAGVRSDIAVDEEIYQRHVQCSRQAEMLRNSSKENPIILSAPSTGLDYDALSGSDHARSDGKFRSIDHEKMNRAAAKELQHNGDFSSKSRASDNATKHDEGVSVNLVADYSQSEMNSSELLKKKQFRRKKSKKLSREERSPFTKTESREYVDLLNSSINGSYQGNHDQENIKTTIDQVGYLSKNYLLVQNLRVALNRKTMIE